MNNKINKKETNIMETKNNSEDYHKRYNRAIQDIHAVLCNNIVNIDEDVAIELVKYDEDENVTDEPYQLFLIGNETDAKRFAYLTDGVYIYSNILDLYVCGVYSFGTAWSYVYENKNV